VGGASWRIFFAHMARQESEPLPEGLHEEDLTEEGLERLRARMLYWMFYQHAWARTSYALAAVSFGALLFRRDKFSAGTFVVCLLLAIEAADLTRIRF
jgi:hypothetical protein